MVEAWTSPTDRGKGQPDSEQSNTMCMVGLKSLLWAFATGKNYRYCQQLMRLKKAIEKNWLELMKKKGVTFWPWQRQTALIHNHSVIWKRKIERAWLDVLMHPPYSPDLAPSDFYLFRSELFRKHKANLKRTPRTLHGRFFNQKSQNFHRNGIITTHKMATSYRSKRHILILNK